MRTSILLMTVAGLAIAGGAAADETLRFAPPEAWVRAITPAATPARAAALAPYAVLNRSFQARLGDDGDTYFGETIIRIQSPLGLKAGQPAFSWSPDTESVTVHRLNILRDGQVIDVLARGQGFTILRREGRLEKSMLDGELTAVLQTEGLEVGDVIDFALSIKRQAGFRKGKSYALWGGIGSLSAGRADYRVQWPAAKPVRWRASQDLPALNIVNGDGMTELVVNLDGYKTPETADEAPARFGRFGELQFTEFASWQEVSAQMAPVYAKAYGLRDGSPLKAEAARIAAVSTDPKVRAGLALKLVQDKVRYAYRAANEGGNVPMDADLTWQRRFGECKAKTVLLIALLHELGIEAAPALVDTEDGDGMNERLPMLGLFDHVITRVVIDGRTYWMDGTGYGDTTVDHLSIPPYKWALPLTAEGSDLVPIVRPPLDLPTMETHLTLDATAGIDAPAPARAVLIQRGDAARISRIQWQTFLPEDGDARLRKYWKSQYRWITITSVSHSYDEATGEMRFVMDGKARMGWSQAGDDHGRLYETDGYDVGKLVTVSRPAGKDSDVPVVVEYPVYERSTETIRLPGGGRDFVVLGERVDTTLAGIQMKRDFALSDGVFTLDTYNRTVVPEISLAEARAAIAPMKALVKSAVFIEAPASATPSGLPGAFVITGKPAAGEGEDEVATGIEGMTGLKTPAGVKPRAAVPDKGPQVVDDGLDEIVELYTPDGIK